jgi:hypothetical protein
VVAYKNPVAGYTLKEKALLHVFELVNRSGLSIQRSNDLFVFNVQPAKALIVFPFPDFSCSRRCLLHRFTSFRAFSRD